MQIHTVAAGGGEDTGEVGPDDAFPFVMGQVGDRHADANAGVVDEGVKPAEALGGGSNRPFSRGGVANVADDAGDASGVANRGCERVFSAHHAVGRGAGKGDAIAVTQQHLGKRVADTA